MCTIYLGASSYVWMKTVNQPYGNDMKPCSSNHEWELKIIMLKSYLLITKEIETKQKLYAISQLAERAFRIGWVSLQKRLSERAKQLPL